MTTELALDQIKRLNAALPTSRSQFEATWFMISSSINLAARAYSRKDCGYWKALTNAQGLFETVPRLLDFAAMKPAASSEGAGS